MEKPWGMSMYTATIPQLGKILRNMEGWLDKAEAHAARRKFDANTLLGARLAPDMFPLVHQFQAACDTAKFLAARLGGKEAPSDPDTEATLAEIRARVQKTAAFVATIQEADFKEAATRLVKIGYLPANQRVLGSVYLNEQALPNFYFHASMAYAILRHNGVDVGKSDFLGEYPLVNV